MEGPKQKKQYYYIYYIIYYILFIILYIIYSVLYIIIYYTLYIMLYIIYYILYIILDIIYSILYIIIYYIYIYIYIYYIICFGRDPSRKMRRKIWAPEARKQRRAPEKLKMMSKQTTQCLKYPSISTKIRRCRLKSFDVD